MRIISLSYGFYPLAQHLLLSYKTGFWVEAIMDILEGRIKLKRMSQGSLFTLAAKQRLSKCAVGAKACGFLLQYQESHYCVSELMGGGCFVERWEQSEQLYPEREEITRCLPFLEEMGTEALSTRKKPVEFKVYYRDNHTHSVAYLGTVIERRKKERGNNFKDLLNKALKEYSDYIEHPSQIFLMGN